MTVKDKSSDRLSYSKNSQPIDKKINTVCKYCGEKLIQTKGHRQKKFCSNKCRFTWWKSPKADLPKASPYLLKCKNCGKKFKRYGKKNQRYCSHGCYILDRFKK